MSSRRPLGEPGRQDANKTSAGAGKKGKVLAFLDPDRGSLALNRAKRVRRLLADQRPRDRPLWVADSTGGCNTLWREPSEECCR